jgi:DNA polymerase V
LTAAHVLPEHLVQPETQMFQLDLFDDHTDTEEETLARERSRQKAVLHIQKKYGKNAIVKGMNLQEGATTMDRNRQIGGHKA